MSARMANALAFLCKYVPFSECSRTAQSCVHIECFRALTGPQKHACGLQMREWVRSHVRIAMRCARSRPSPTEAWAERKGTLDRRKTAHKHHLRH
jgi:hypothetical protein